MKDLHPKAREAPHLVSRSKWGGASLWKWFEDFLKKVVLVRSLCFFFASDDFSAGYI